MSRFFVICISGSDLKRLAEQIEDELDFQDKRGYQLQTTTSTTSTKNGRTVIHVILTFEA